MITYACTQDTKILKESNNDKKIIDGVIVHFPMNKMAFELRCNCFRIYIWYIYIYIMR